MSVGPEAIPARTVARLPTGTVTFAFTDIEGSTVRWERNPTEMQGALRRHDALMHAAIASHGGYVFKTIGDAFCSVFWRPQDALSAMLTAQQALSSEDFSAVNGLRVRVAIHSGTADERDADYFGPAVNRVARLLAIGHGEQVLVSGASHSLIDWLPAQVTLGDLGEHRLNDLTRPERVYQLLRPGLRAAFPPLRSLDAVRNNLPLQLTSFVGREREIAEVQSLLAAHRLVTIVGSGGVGKTRTSLQIGAHLLDHFVDGVWFIELAPLANGDYLATTVAQAMGITLGNAADPLVALTDALKAQRALLMFDNCEHLVEPSARIIATLLRSCPQIRALATSRQPLGIAGETSYRMPSLTWADAATGQTAADVCQFPAIALFVERATAVDHRFTLGDENAAVVADICRRLDGIPLAIELAAARVRILSPRQLRERLDERFRLLTGGSRDLLPRQKTLRALIDWSHDLLDDRERSVLRRLAVFVTGFTLEGAVAVGGTQDIDELDVFDVLASLVDKSLVLTEPDSDTRRYRMLESTRAYAREKLEAAGERPDCASRHRRYLRDQFSAAMTHADRTGHSAAIDALLIAQLDDVRVALDGASEAGELEIGAELLAAIDSRWHWVGLGGEGSVRLERAIACMPDDERRLTSRLWTAFARIARDASPALAQEAAATAVHLAREANDSHALAHALIVYADKLVRSRRIAEATTVLTEAQQLASPDNIQFRLRILQVRAFLDYFVGDLAAAAAAHRQLRATYVEIGNVSGANSVSTILAEIDHERGQTAQAVAAIAHDVLPVLRSGHQRNSLILALSNQCGYLVALNDVVGAYAMAREVFHNSSADDRSAILVTSTIEHVALALVLDDKVRSGAQLAGYTEAFAQRVGYQREFTERTTRVRLEALLDDKLSPTQRDGLFTEGAALSPDDAIALVLSSVNEQRKAES